MFNIGPPEIIVILLIALLVVGPKRLPELGRTIGKGMREFRRASDEVRYSFESHLDEEPASYEEARARDNGRKDTDQPDVPGKKASTQPSAGPEE